MTEVTKQQGQQRPTLRRSSLTSHGEGHLEKKQGLPGEILDEVRLGHTQKEIPQKSAWGGIPAVKDSPR